MLKIVRRKQTGALTIDGFISGRRYQRRAQSQSLALAREEATAWEAEILRTQWHGPQQRVDAHTLDEALVKYLEAKPRHDMTKVRLERLRTAIGGDTPLAGIGQDTITKLRAGLFAGAAEATILREAITPLRAVLKVAAKRKWCDPPEFETPELPEGRTEFFLPNEAERLISAAGPHIRPLLIFLFATGARLSEAVYLEWRDVNLMSGRVIFWGHRTKARKRRNVELSPRAITALANLPHREGAVFRRPDGQPYADRGGMYGGQIKKAWAGALRRAGLRAELTPHSCRHTWASWHYALHKDPIRLKFDGGWASLNQVERYAHLMDRGYEAEIREFQGVVSTQGGLLRDDAVTGPADAHQTIENIGQFA